jgi:chromosome segregation ATPase
MTAANPTDRCEMGLGNVCFTHERNAIDCIRVLEAELAQERKLKRFNLQEADRLSEACKKWEAENAALKTEFAEQEKELARQFHRAEKAEAQVEQQTSLLESCRKALVKVKARVAELEAVFACEFCETNFCYEHREAEQRFAKKEAPRP